MLFFFFKQKTAYEMRISDWSSDVCSSDLIYHVHPRPRPLHPACEGRGMNSPTSRSLKHLRDLGYAAAVVERRVPGKPITIDLFGCIDLVAVDERGRIAWVQTTTASNMASRRNKLKDNDILPFLAMNGNRVILHGWKDRKSTRLKSSH